MPTTWPFSRENPTTIFFAQRGLHFVEGPVVDDEVNDVEDVVRLPRIVGDDLVELRFPAPGIVGRRDVRRILEVVLREVGEELFDHRDALFVVLGDEVGHAALAVVGERSAELLEGHVLVRDLLDHVRVR